MSARIFLERLLVGDSMTDTTTDPFMLMEPDDQTLRLVARFQEIIGNYSRITPDKYGALSSEALSELRKAGFFGLDIPRVFGGIGLNIFQYLRVVESVAALSMDIGITALAHLSIGTKGIVLFGSEEQKRKYLVPAAQGRMIFSYALTEPLHGSDAKHIETTAMWDESADCYILNGRKAYITNANLAKGLTVFAQMDPARPGHLGAFIVETGWEGVTIGKEIPKMGLNASSTASIKITNVRVPKSNLFGKPGDGFKIAMTILNYGRLALGAASSGIMKRTIADMAKRTSQRIQFGQPIYKFQLVQEKLVRVRLNSYPNLKRHDTIHAPHSKNYKDYEHMQPLTGAEIPIESLIVGLADRYDALRSKRPYKEGYSHEKVLSVLSNGESSGQKAEQTFGNEIWGVFMNKHHLFNDIYESMLN